MSYILTYTARLIWNYFNYIIKNSRSLIRCFDFIFKAFVSHASTTKGSVSWNLILQFSFSGTPKWFTAQYFQKIPQVVLILFLKYFQKVPQIILTSFLKYFQRLPESIFFLHSCRSYYIDLLLIKMAVLAMFQEIWCQFKIPSTNWQQFPKHGTGHFSNQSSKS